jgi:hypothetical protein
MCLISLVPKGVKKDIVLIKSFVENGMSTNSDGSGYAIKKDGKLYLSKGYRQINSLVLAIDSHKLGLSDELMIHHRTGTSGKRDSINMHPFIVTEDQDELKTTEGNTNMPIISHNGVFGSFSDYHSDFSDTFHFIKDFLSTPEFVSLLKKDPIKFEKLFKNVLGGNKLAFLFKDRDMVTTGNFTEDGGYLHSNSGYKSHVYDRGGSSEYFNGGLIRNRFVNKSHTPPATRRMSEFDDADWAHYHDTTLGNSHQTVGNSLDLKLEKSKVRTIETPKVLGTAFMFETKDIKITEENFNHFIFVVKDIDYTAFITKNKGFEIESFDPLVMTTPIVSKSNTRIVHHVNLERFVDYCNIFIKDEYKEDYRGLNKLLLMHGYNPSKSTLKKITTILSRKMSKKQFKFKEYGLMSWRDLDHYKDEVLHARSLSRINEDLNSDIKDDMYENYYSEMMD